MSVETRRVASRPRATRTPSRSRVLVWAAWVGTPLLRLVRTHPGRSAAAFASSVMMAGIVANATLLQRGRHPAPLFANPQGAAPPARSPRPSASPQPLARAAAPGDTVEADTGAGAGRPKATIRADEPRRDKGLAAAAGDDTPTGVAGPKLPDPDVLRAQHALLKLGFDIKPDGVLGAETRKALDRFAGAHHLSGMSGALTPKLLQALLLAAGKPQG